MNQAVQDLLEDLGVRHPELESCLEALGRAFELISVAFRGGLTLLVCGNGGSAADAEHIVGELMKGFRLPRRLQAAQERALAERFPAEGPELARRLQRGLPAISLVSQSSLVSAIANDTSAEMVFAQQVFVYGRPGGVLLAISTSGRAVNVLNAVRVARAFGLGTIALTGPTGELAHLCDVAIMAPGTDTSGIQENHLRLYHTLCAMLEQELFSQ